MTYQKTEFEETQRQWREELCCWQCFRLQANDFAPYCSDKCRQRYAIEADEDKGRRGQQGFEHKGDVSIIDNLKAEARHLVETDSVISGPGTPPLAKREQLKLWAKFINHQYAAWSALFELITGYRPPKMKEVAAIISGH
jgi:hypothetical protein